MESVIQYLLHDSLFQITADQKSMLKNVGSKADVRKKNSRRNRKAQDIIRVFFWQISRTF